MTQMYRALMTPPPLREQVYFAMEDLMLEGHLSPGDRLVESELAEQLGISRGPIREALQLLERDGWLEVKPRRGTYVRATGEHELDDYFQARILLEAEACRLAARRARREPDVTGPLIEEARQQIQRSRQLSEQLSADASEPTGPERDLRRNYRENSRSIHRTIADLSGNVALAELIEYVVRRTRWYFGTSAPKDRRSRRDEHHDVLEAIVDGNEELAAKRMGEHVERLRVAAIGAVRQTEAPD